MNETTAAPTAPALPATLRLGAVHLTVTDLDRSVGFYQDAIGLQLARARGRRRRAGRRRRGPARAPRGAVRAARRPPRRALPLRAAAPEPRGAGPRARAPRRAPRTPIEGASDHGISEAIYLPDPDGNGIELAADRPREAWPADWGDLRPEPLDMHGLLGLVAGEEPQRHADPGARRRPPAPARRRHRARPRLLPRRASASRSRRCCRAPRSSRPAATTITSASTSGAARACRPRPPGTVGLREWTVVLPEAGLARAARAGSTRRASRATAG